MGPRARFVDKIHFCQNPTRSTPYLKGDNSANIEQICTTFNRQTDNNVVEHVLRQNSTKFKMAATAILKGTFPDINRSLLPDVLRTGLLRMNVVSPILVSKI